MEAEVGGQGGIGKFASTSHKTLEVEEDLFPGGRGQGRNFKSPGTKMKFEQFLQPHLFPFCLKLRALGFSLLPVL